MAKTYSEKWPAITLAIVSVMLFLLFLFTNDPVLRIVAILWSVTSFAGSFLLWMRNRMGRVVATISVMFYAYPLWGYFSEGKYLQIIFGILTMLLFLNSLWFGMTFSNDIPDAVKFRAKRRKYKFLDKKK